MADNKLDSIIWNEISSSNKPEVTKVGSEFVMDKMPYHSISKEDVIDDDSLKYESEGKSISFKPLRIEWDKPHPIYYIYLASAKLYKRSLRL